MLTVSCDSVSIASVKQQWKLDQLGSLVAHALSQGYEPAQSGRVRAVPDRRTIRYYTTLGLVDRPSEMRGRTAYYGRRHLLQLVAIKRLQGQGQSLREVQAHLAGLNDAALEEIAALPELAAVEAARGGALAERTQDVSELVTGRAASFWAARPPVAEVKPEAPRGPAAEALRAIGLGEGVSLLLPGGPELAANELAALARAAAPLLAELDRMGVLHGGERGPAGRPNDGHGAAGPDRSAT
jgi:DNA-binding transcriptional MerR regulator